MAFFMTNYNVPMNKTDCILGRKTSRQMPKTVVTGWSYITFTCFLANLITTSGVRQYMFSKFVTLACSDYFTYYKL